jgi:hypothetical protein
MKKISWTWFIAALVLITYGCFAIYKGEVYIGHGNFIKGSSEKRSFWFYSIVFIHAGIASLFFSWKSYYPIRLQSLMSFSRESRLSWSQVIFILSLTSILFFSSFYLAGLFSKK